MSLLYTGCQSTVFKVGFVTFATFVLLFRLDIHLCKVYQLFSDKKLVPPSQTYVIMAGLELFICLRTTICYRSDSEV